MFFLSCFVFFLTLFVTSGFFNSMALCTFSLEYLFPTFCIPLGCFTKWTHLMDLSKSSTKCCFEFFSSPFPPHSIIFPQIATQLLLHTLKTLLLNFSFHLFSRVLIAPCCFGSFVTRHLEKIAWQHVRHKPHMNINH